MRSNFINKIFVIIFLLLIQNISYSAETFNFDVTEVEILENGNVFKGSKRGLITTGGGIKLEADNFNYNKNSNVLKASGKVKIEDSIYNYLLFSDQITYLRNENIIFETGFGRVTLGLGEIEYVCIDPSKYFSTKSRI